MALVVKALLALGLTLILCVLLANLLAARAERRTEAAFPPEGQILTVEGQRIHAVVRGSGPDLVVIHGASSNVRDFTFSLMDELADRFRVIAIDRPGFGYTSSPPDGVGSLAYQARMLSQAATQLGADKPIVLGHSYGGAVAMAWAVHHPDRLSALVIESGATMVWPGGIDRIYELLGSRIGSTLLVPAVTATLTSDYVERGVAATFAPQDPPPGFSAHLGGALALRRETLRVNARQRIALWDEIQAQSTRYGDITLPVEIVHGDADTIVSLDIHARGMMPILPDAQLTVLPGIGHNPHNTVPGAIAATVDRAARRAGLR